MNKDDFYNLEADFNSEAINKLPVNYRLMQKTTGKGSLKVVESELHQTNIYIVEEFYKPISKTIDWSQMSYESE